jgi:thioredoxin 1
MKRNLVLFTIVLTFLLVSCKTAKNNNPVDTTGIASGEIVKPLTNDTFKEYVFNYDTGKTWDYKGDKPAIIDFYADWCPPCRELSPLVEEVAKEYEGKIVVYKVNTDQQREVTQALGITGLPTLLYIPVKGKPQLVVGYVPKESLIKGVKEVLLNN